MEVLDEGYRYRVANMESPNKGQEIRFINKTKAEDSNELKTVYDGTTNEELMEVLLDRMKYLNGKFPCLENGETIHHLQVALNFQHSRTRDRKKRNVEGKHIA